MSFLVALLLHTGPGRAALTAAGFTLLAEQPRLLLAVAVLAGLWTLTRLRTVQYAVARVLPGRAIATAGLLALFAVAVIGGPDLTPLAPSSNMATH